MSHWGFLSNSGGWKSGHSDTWPRFAQVFPDRCWPVERTGWGTIFHQGLNMFGSLDYRHTGCFSELEVWWPVLTQSHQWQKQRLAATPYNNNICHGSRSHKTHNAAEILPFSFPSTTEWSILAAILKACSILLHAEGAFPSVPLQPGPGQGLLCHCAPTASVERQPCGLARTSPHFSTPISISSLLHAPKFSTCKSLWRGLSNFHGAPSEHWVSGLFFFPSFPRLHSWWQGLAQCIKTISYLFIMGKDTCICNWFDRRQHDSCFTGFSIEIANERLAGIYGTYLYPKQKGNNIHSDKPCLYTALSKFVPSAGSRPSSGLVQSGTAPPTPRQLHQFTPRKKWGIIFPVTHQNYKRWGGGEGESSDLQEGWRRAASQAATCWRGIDLSVFARLGLWIWGGVGCNKDRNILEATHSCQHSNMANSSWYSSPLFSACLNGRIPWGKLCLHPCFHTGKRRWGSPVPQGL